MYLEKKQAEEKLVEYEKDMQMQELSARTIHKYLADIGDWLKQMEDVIITKEMVISYKKELSKNYKVASINSKIISVNRYLRWLDFSDLVVRTERIQAPNVLDKMITKENYFAMLKFAKDSGRSRLYYIMKTIAGTGLRVGELKYVTVQAITDGYTQIWNKGKYRYIYFSESLCMELMEYCNNSGINKGIIFIGRKEEKVITSAAVWKGLKNIAKELGIPEDTVFPHSFRHLFAKNYMEKVGDITELADILGHSRLETTWIYTKTTSAEKRKRLELLDL
ncbi:MAG: tyrosine-type recombinase/integrase [Lachnospiraceae bacterium]